MQARNLYTGLLSASLSFAAAGLTWIEQNQPSNPMPRPSNPIPRPVNPQPRPVNPTPPPTNPAPRNPSDPPPSPPTTPDPNQPAQPRPGVNPGNPVNPGVPSNPNPPGTPPNSPGVGAPIINRQGVPFSFQSPQAQVLFTQQARQLVQIEQRLSQANQDSLRRLGEIRQLGGERQNAALMDLFQQVLRDQAAFQQYLVQTRTLLTGDIDAGDAAPAPPPPQPSSVLPQGPRPDAPRTNPR